MPVVAKCPNCNGPLDKAPTGPEQKCPYCGATLLATRFMPSPGVPGAYPPPAAPLPGAYAPPPAWGSPPGAPTPGAYPPPAPLPPIPSLSVSTVAKRSMTMYIVSSAFTMLIIGGVVAATMFAQKEVADRTQQAVNAASVSAEQRTAPVKLTPLTLEPGKEVELTLPASDGTHMGRVVATLNVSLQEQTPFEITMSSSSVITRCRMKALDAQNKALARAADEDDNAQIYPVLPQGASTIIVDCDSHPGERSVRVLARPLPLVLPGQSVQIVIEPGSESAGAGVIPDQAGLYVIALEGSDSSTALQVLGADDVLVGKQDINSSTDRALVEAPLQVEGYLVQALRTFAADQKMPFTVTLTRVEPERILLGTETAGTLPRQAARRYYLLRLDAPTKVAVTLRSSAFDHAVELQRADGVAIATSDEQRAGQTARVAPNVPLEVGEYRIVVRGEEYEASAGDFTLKVEAVVDAPPTKRGGRRGSR